jgi:hypothetical protein
MVCCLAQLAISPTPGEGCDNQLFREGRLRKVKHRRYILARLCNIFLFSCYEVKGALNLLDRSISREYPITPSDALAITGCSRAIAKMKVSLGGSILRQDNMASINALHLLMSR